VRENEVAEHGDHERVSAALVEEAVDPELEAAVESELCTEDFVFAKDQEEDANADAEDGQGAAVGEIV